MPDPEPPPGQPLPPPAMARPPKPRRDHWDRVVWLVRVGVILAAVGIGFGWGFRVLTQHPLGPVSGVDSVAQLASVARPAWLWWGIGGALTLAVVALLIRPALASGASCLAAVGAALAIAFAAASSSLGNAVTVALLSAFLAVTLAAVIGRRRAVRVRGRSAQRERAIALLLWLLVATIGATFALHRYRAFGSGSWDMGCMIHNFYRASRFLDTTSTVLGNVDFLGDHFMLGIYLYAPLFWLSASGEMLILIQSVNLAATAAAIYLIARHRGAGTGVAVALGLAAGLSFGNQSAFYFDSHEICVGFGFLAFAVWALEVGRLPLATLFLACFALFKESLGAYVVAIGLLLLWRGITGKDRRKVSYALAWIAGGALWFVLVNRVMMPALIARASPPEPHETFADFGPTVFQALLGIAADPLRALGALFVPGEKLRSMLVTLGGVGYLAFAGPEIAIAALPLLAERFLSSKTTMWEMGYHYAAPLCFYAAWATAAAWPRVRIGARKVARRLGLASSQAPAMLALYLVASLGLTSAIGYRHPSNFLRWEMDYFSTPARRVVNRRAVALLLEQGREAKLAVQNRILPQLAARPHIYRLGEWEKADWVLLSIGESAWPWDDGLPGRLARQLQADPRFKLVFSEGDARIFARLEATDLPPVSAGGIAVDGGAGGQ